MSEKITNTEYIHIVKDVFSEEMVKELKTECDLHFKKNLLFSDKIEVTKCIIDCHGLALSTSSYFPYDKRCWNIFCLKIKKHIIDYFYKVNIDEYSIVPHSCWAERAIKSNHESDVYYEEFRIADDDWLNKHLVRSIYYLKNNNVNYGTDIRYTNSIKSISGLQNSLVIFDGGSHPSSNKFPIGNSAEKYNIVFDWYINEPFDVPDWVLP